MPDTSYLSVLNLGDNVERRIRDSEAISFARNQSLTDAQKAQARSNIGAGTSSYNVASVSDITTGTDTESKVIRSDYLNTAINSLIDTKINVAITQVLNTQY